MPTFRTDQQFTIFRKASSNGLGEIVYQKIGVANGAAYDVSSEISDRSGKKHVTSRLFYLVGSDVGLGDYIGDGDLSAFPSNAKEVMKVTRNPLFPNQVKVYA